MYRLFRNLYILFFLVVVIFSSGWFFLHLSTQHSITKSAEAEATLAVQALCLEIDGWLGSQSRVVEAGASFISLNRWEEEDILAYLKKLLKNNADLTSIYYGTAQNKMFNASGWIPPADFDLRQRPWYVKAAAGTETIFTEAFLNASADRMIITIARPVFDDNGNELLGVIGADVPIDQIVSMINLQAEDKGAYSFLIDNKDIVLAHPGLPYSPEKELVTLSHLLGLFEGMPAEELAGSNWPPEPENDFLSRQGLIELELEGEPGVLAYQFIDRIGWRMATFIPAADYLQASSAASREFIILFMAAALIFGAFIFYYHRQIQNPLLDFENNIRQIEFTDSLNYRLPIRKKEELSSLGKTINRLLDKAQDYFEKLEEKEQALLKVNQELEEMIRQLTTTEEALDYSEEKLYFLSYHDQLTGLYNRSYFEAKLNQLSGSPAFPTTIIYLDIDGLKLINDTISHSAGDRLLKICAAIIKDTLGETGILARVGGDEFSIILPLTGREEAEGLARQIRTQAEFYNRQNVNLPLSLSIGVVTSKSSGLSIFTLAKQAEDEMLKNKLSRSSSARNGVVRSLLAALAERDFSSALGVETFVELCTKVGEKIKLSSPKLSNLALLAHVHDVGIVGIPDKILFKEGPLCPEEQEIMQKHPEKGYRITISSTDLAGIADLVLKHHEHFDGSGYPLGISAADIPVECRILRIVDAYDAMISERPFKTTYSKEAALAELRLLAGAQFDPELVEVFCATICPPEPAPFIRRPLPDY